MALSTGYLPLAESATQYQRSFKPLDPEWKRSDRRVSWRTHLCKTAGVGLILFALGCQTRPTRPSFDYASNIGLAVEAGGYRCLSIPNATLAVGQRLQLISATSTPVIAGAEVLGPANDACKSVDQDRPGMTRYAFNVVQGTLASGAPAFAIANFGKTLTTTDDGISADLDQNGKQEFLRSCTSAEGVHLTIWGGKPLAGERKWHDYYALGYDVTSNCTPNETKPD